jgi:uncharacterized Tic20 family protein
MRASGDDLALQNRLPRPHVAALALSLLSLLLPVFSPLLVPLVAWQVRLALRDRGRLSEREGGIVPMALSALLCAVASVVLFVFYLNAVVR